MIAYYSKKQSRAIAAADADKMWNIFFYLVCCRAKFNEDESFSVCLQMVNTYKFKNCDRIFFAYIHCDGMDTNSIAQSILLNV